MTKANRNGQHNSNGSRRTSYYGNWNIRSTTYRRVYTTSFENDPTTNAPGKSETQIQQGNPNGIRRLADTHVGEQEETQVKKPALRHSTSGVQSRTVNQPGPTSNPQQHTESDNAANSKDSVAGEAGKVRNHKANTSETYNLIYDMTDLVTAKTAFSNIAEAKALFRTFNGASYNDGTIITLPINGNLFKIPYSMDKIYGFSPYQTEHLISNAAGAQIDPEEEDIDKRHSLYN
nr:unnamed protein product [Callosobruchus analis]